VRIQQKLNVLCLPKPFKLFFFYRKTHWNSKRTMNLPISTTLMERWPNWKKCNRYSGTSIAKKASTWRRKITTRNVLTIKFTLFSLFMNNLFILLFFSGIRKILEAKLRMSDSQYNRLLETMSAPSDYTYAQTMMDEIIYQLAKLMFNQGLFIGMSRR